MKNILDAPCKWCGYNGSGYWQAGTHKPECPFYRIGGARERANIMQNKPLLDSKDQTIAALAEENRRLREDNGILQANNKNLRGEISGYKADFGNTEAQTIADLRKENSELKETLAAYDYHYGGLHPAAVEGIKKQMARKATEG